MKKTITRFVIIALAINYSIAANAQVMQPQKNNSKKEKGSFSQKIKPALLTAPQSSATPGLIDGTDVQIHPSANVQAEVTIALNKTNPQNLVASANTLIGPFNYNQGYYYSYDGGASWGGKDSLQNISVGTVSGDPSVCFAANGAAYLTAINASSGYWFQRSNDGGATWSAGKKGSNTISFDKEMSASDDQLTSPYKNNFYCSWTNFSSGGGSVEFNRSTDKGLTFSTPITLRSGAIGFGQGTNVQTGPNGEVYVCWADHKTVTSPYKADALGFARSMDGGVTFTPAAKPFNYKGIRVDGFDATFNHSRVNDFPAMAVDKSNGAHRGRIYVTYPAKQNDTGKSVIYVRWSDDKGTTWSAGKVVSIPNGRQNWFPWIAVDDSTGRVWVDYYSFDKPTGFLTNTYVAVSPNGGNTWFNRVVSDVPHKTAAIDNNNFAYGYAGDYIGLAVYGGKATAVWMDDRTGDWQVYATSITESRSAPLTGTYSDAETLKVNSTISAKISAGPNPFTSYIIIKGADKFASIQLCTQAGIVAKQWKNFESNMLNVSDVPKGIYLLKVTVDNISVPFTETLIK